MKTLVIDNTTYNIPERWEEITFEKQIAVERYAKEEPAFQELCIIAGYCNIPLSDLKHLHINTVVKLLENLEFIKTPQTSAAITSFVHHGSEYLVMPSLLKAEFQDFISLEVLREQHKDRLYEGLPMMIAILAKREGETLDSFEVEQRAKEFYDLPITIANGLYAFFLHSSILYSTDLRESAAFQDQVIQQQLDSIKNILNKQAGKGLPLRWRALILKKFVKSIESRWNSYYSRSICETEKPN